MAVSKFTGKPTRGRPKGIKKIGPEQLEEIGRLVLRGVTRRIIAKKYGVTPQAIDEHVNRHFKPLWAAAAMLSRDEELAKIAELERTAWECFTSEMPAETNEQAKENLLEKMKGNKKTKQILLGIVERVTRKKFKTAQTAYLDIVQWCIETRCKIGGFYSATKIEIDGQFRVAGLQPHEIDEKMLELLAQRVADRRQYQRALGAMHGRN